MLKTQIKDIEEKQKAYAKVYGIMTLIVFVSLSVFIGIKYAEYSAIRTAISTNEERVLEISDEVSTQKALYETNKEDFQKTSEEISTKLATIFPASDEYTELTRQIDVVEEELNRLNDTFEISNLDFQASQEDEEGNYSYLPLRMNIKSSSENFQKFLHKIENSGSLNDNLRLMDISSIKLSFQDGEDEDDKMINFSVLINAYFQ